MTTPDAKRIADRYIGRDGEELGRADDSVPIVRDIVDVASFIAWHDTTDVYGGVKANLALEAFARIVNIPAQKLRSAMRGDAIAEGEKRGRR